MIYNKPQRKKGETWVLNEMLTVNTEQTFEISFNVTALPDRPFELFRMRPRGKSGNTYWNTTIIYRSDSDNLVAYSGRWMKGIYRTVTFSRSPTGDLLAWLQENAVKQ